MSKLSNVKQIVVHNGESHLDDIMCVAFAMHMIGHSVPVWRKTPTENEINDPSVLVMDVGGVYDPERMDFDHHQRSRTEEPKCGFRLLLEYYGFWEEYKEIFPWLQTWNEIDVCGPFAVCKKNGIEPNTMFNIMGPMYDICRNIMEDDVPAYHKAELIYKYVTVPIINQNVHVYHLMKWDVNYFKNPFGLKILDYRIWNSKRLDTKFCGMICPDLDMILLPPNERNPKSFTLLRYNDSPKINLAQVEMPEIEFKHPGGFIAVTKSFVSDEKLLEMIGMSLVNN